MTPQGALAVLRRIDAVDPYAPRLDARGHAARTETFVALLPTAPDEWVMTWVMDRLRTGVIPTQIDVVEAWRTEQQRRCGGQEMIPAAPEEVELDAARWLTWERTRRRALLDGRTSDEAVAAADAAVGVTRAPEPVMTAGDVERVRRRLRATLDAVAARRVGAPDAEVQP